MILWRCEHTDGVLEHLTRTETEYLLTQSMSAAFVSLLTFLAHRMKILCVWKATWVKHIPVTGWRMFLWHCEHSSLHCRLIKYDYGSQTICETWHKCLSFWEDIHNCKHLCTTSTRTETHTPSMVGCWVSVRLLVDEIRGVPFISSPRFSWSADSSERASHLTVSARQCSDSELREQTGRM